MDWSSPQKTRGILVTLLQGEPNQQHSSAGPVYLAAEMVARGGIEPPTRGFSVRRPIIDCLKISDLWCLPLVSGWGTHLTSKGGPFWGDTIFHVTA